VRGQGTKRLPYEGGRFMDEQRQPDPQEKEPELKRPDEAVKDLEPDREEGDAVKGGANIKLDLKY
jgi:hypothetical protein